LIVDALKLALVAFKHVAMLFKLEPDPEKLGGRGGEASRRGAQRVVDARFDPLGTHIQENLIFENQI
jgi:hypothetical protein